MEALEIYKTKSPNEKALFLAAFEKNGGVRGGLATAVSETVVHSALELAGGMDGVEVVVEALDRLELGAHDCEFYTKFSRMSRRLMSSWRARRRACSWPRADSARRDPLPTSSWASRGRAESVRDDESSIRHR